MKRIFFALILYLLYIPFANANTIKSIKMDIYLDNNGNAHIDEIWDMRTNEKTENYKPYYNLGESEISNFKVSENGREYEYIDNWNIKADLSQKAYKNGFYYEDGATELCWGISSYGDHSYHLSYDISNMIINTTDGYQVFYWQLIPYDMNPTADSYDITIRTDNYLEDTLDVWGYGAYGKYAYVADGVVKLVGEDKLSTDEYVVGLVKFNNGTFNTDYTSDKSFDDFLNMAEKGATHYKDKSDSFLYKLFKTLIGFIPYIIFTVIIVIAANSSGRKKYFKSLLFKEEEKKLPKDYPMFREIPCKKNIYAANYIGFAYDINKKEENYIGCIILKWLKDDIITTDNTDKHESKIILKHQTLPEDYTSITHEIELYTWMYDASKDGILTTRDFKKYCKNHYSKILGWGEKSFSYGRSECESLGYITKSTEKSNKYNVQRSFYDEGLKIAGLKKFLIEFSDMKNKEPIEVHLWQEYLIFAQMFGIAKKVAEKFNDLYPEVYEQSNYDYHTFIFINDFTTTGISAASSARSAAQSYSSGGGGFYSGGGGGGSFGGGGGGGGSR